MSLSEAIPWLSRSGPRRFVLETCRAAWKSSPDITVVRIDEEETSIVTWEYVALMRYMVYNMKLVHHGKASRTLSGRNHRTHRRWTLEGSRSRATLPRHQAIFRTKARYYRNHATNALPATPRSAEHGNRRTYRLRRHTPASCICDYSSRKISAAVAGHDVPLGQVALGCHGIEKAPSFRSAAISPLRWISSTPTSVCG